MENSFYDLFFGFAIKRSKKDKIFKFLDGRFSVTGDPINMIFWHVLRNQSKASKIY